MVQVSEATVQACKEKMKISKLKAHSHVLFLDTFKSDTKKGIISNFYVHSVSERQAGAAAGAGAGVFMVFLIPSMPLFWYYISDNKLNMPCARKIGVNPRIDV